MDLSYAGLNFSEGYLVLNLLSAFFFSVQLDLQLAYMFLKLEILSLNFVSASTGCLHLDVVHQRSAL